MSCAEAATEHHIGAVEGVAGAPCCWAPCAALLLHGS